MSILYIRLPSKAAAEGVEHWLALPSAFALTAQGESIEKEGVAPLSGMAGLVASASRVILLLAASDVSILSVKAPPLSAAKLKLALPNLVEEQLMADPSECVVVPGPLLDGLRMAAVVQRGWLEILAQTFTSYGARSLLVVPAQLCLPHPEGAVSAAITEQGIDIDVSVRLSELEAMGLPLVTDSTEAAAQQVLRTLRAVVPALPINLYVPQAHVLAFQEAASDHGPAPESGIVIFADSWVRWIAGVGKTPLNMMTGLGAGSGPQVNWRQWRLPAALALLLVLVNALGLNIDWWRMKREATTLKAAMMQTFKSTYPKETVILDPVAQMHKKIADAERNAGQAAPDDFGQLAASFADVLNTVLRDKSDAKGHKTAASVIASLEYRERSLLVHVKPDSQLSTEKMKVALSARNLTLSSPSNGVWQIGSAK